MTAKKKGNEMYEIRKISRAIEDATTGIVAPGTTTTGIDNAMIAETEAQTIARAQHWDDVQDSITVAHSKTPAQQQHEKQRLAHQDRLAAGVMAYALQCATEFDADACRAQFDSECV
jgi:Fe-S cluster assembly scaffold protein SufB